MHVLELRGRFLIAMGLSAASMMACSKDGATSEPKPAASDAATPTASATASASAGVAIPVQPTGISGGGGCGFVVVCQDQAKGAPPQHAAAPYERCALSVGEHDTGSEPHGEGPFDEELTKTRRATEPNVCCYKGRRLRCGGGRPLRGETGPIVAEASLRADWLDATLALTLDVARSEDLEARWLREAAFEHASVASFARASLQLLALGAPSELVAAVHGAALDEIEHARAFFALAARRGAAARGPGPLAVDQAPLAMTFGAFVRDTFLDGCVAETSAAIEVRSRADDGDPLERAALARIAEDEERHAELSWRMLAWGLRAGGAEARASLRVAVDTIEGSASHADPIVRNLVLPCVRALLADHAVAPRHIETMGFL